MRKQRDNVEAIKKAASDSERRIIRCSDGRPIVTHGTLAMAHETAEKLQWKDPDLRRYWVEPKPVPIRR